MSSLADVNKCTIFTISLSLVQLFSLSLIDIDYLQHICELNTMQLRHRAFCTLAWYCLLYVKYVVLYFGCDEVGNFLTCVLATVVLLFVQ